jgi:hypothetical protein
MVAYSFQPQFIDPIKSGRKTQTVRAIGKRRHAQKDNKLQLYTGMRTKSCRKIGDAVCQRTAPIIIRFDARLDRSTFDEVEIDRVKMRAEDLELFAQADGFKSWADLRAFWAKHHPGVQRFEGLVIYWIEFAAAG